MTITTRNLCWLAGIVEGEGWIGSVAGRPALRVEMTDRDVVERIASMWHPARQVAARTREANRKQLFTAGVHGVSAAGWLMTLYPLLGARRRARIKEVLAPWMARPTIRVAARWRLA